MKIFVTKYALTRGIFEADASQSILNKSSVRGSDGMYYFKSDYRLTLIEAMERAEEMRVKKIASLEASLARYKEMSFRDNKEEEGRNG